MNDPNYKDYYKTLLNELPLYPNPCFHQIEIDLPRGNLEKEFNDQLN